MLKKRILNGNAKMTERHKSKSPDVRLLNLSIGQLTLEFLSSCRKKLRLTKKFPRNLMIQMLRAKNNNSIIAVLE